MNDEQLLRYSRHLLLEDIDIAGQEKLLNSHVLIIGAGGLGSACAPYLAAAGVGQITLVDHDRVELTNLQRQIMHQNNSVGMSKVWSGKRFLNNLNPGITIHAIEQKADEALLEELVMKVSVVIDCTDNFITRHLINRISLKHGKTLVSGAAIGFDAQISVFDFKASKLTLLCLRFSTRPSFFRNKLCEYGRLLTARWNHWISPSSTGLTDLDWLWRTLTGAIIDLECP